jgi:hypothetical protein
MSKAMNLMNKRKEKIKKNKKPQKIKKTMIKTLDTKRVK